MTTRAPARGFTLLEVMVAMSILAMGLIAAFDVVGGALRNHERTRQLELGTMLARAKLAEVEAKYEEDGFRDFDQTEEGTFEEMGHAEVSWAVLVRKPTVELGAEGVVKALTGADGGLEGLLGAVSGGDPSKGGGSGAAGGLGGAGGAAGNPVTAAIVASLQQQLVSLGEEIKKGVREVRLSVSWKSGARSEGFDVVTHLVVLVPGSVAATTAAPTLPGLTLPGAPGAGPQLPGITPQPPAFAPPPPRPGGRR